MVKPKFLFFKMLGCGHCVTFYEKPTKETSVWAKLVRDKELSDKVDFVLYEWGKSKNSDGEVEMHQLPDKYSFVNYGPYFFLQSGADSEADMDKDTTYAQGFEVSNVGRSYDEMKNWILTKLTNEPRLKAKAAPRNTPTNLASQSLPSHLQHAMNRYQAPSPQVQSYQPAPARATPQQRVQPQAYQTQQHQPIDGSQGNPFQVNTPVRVASQPMQQQQAHARQPVVMEHQVQAPAPAPQQNKFAATSTGIEGMVLRKQAEEAPTRKFIARNARK